MRNLKEGVFAVAFVVGITSTTPSAAFVTSAVKHAVTPPSTSTTTVIADSVFFSESVTLPSSMADDDSDAVTAAKMQIEESIASTDRGRSVESTQRRAQLHALLSNLEALNPLSEPARDARMEGSWVVHYTDAPPPSNGQLGIFRGIAKQVIDLKDKRYRNELYVGGGSSRKGPNNDGGDVQGAWLKAVLDASWNEWDGVYLDSAGVENQSSSLDNNERKYVGEDHGATTWKVDFVSLTLSIFQIPIFTQQFKKGTSRTWKMTYLDDDTRIVRAGKTGRGQDDWIFYMKRG